MHRSLKYFFALYLTLTSLTPAYSDICNQDECCPCECGTWYLNVDFLWWRADEEDLALGKEVWVSREGLNPTTRNFAHVSKNAKEKEPNFDFDPGFKLGLGYNFADASWNAEAIWTHYQTTATATGKSKLIPADTSGNDYLAFIPYWESLGKNFPLFSKGKWSLNIDWLDIDVGINYVLSSHFAIRPYFGLRGASIRQEYKVHSENHITGDFNGSSYDYVSKSKSRCNFLGGGPLAGLEAQFNMGYGFAFFGKVAAALLVGKFDRHAHEHFENADFFFYQFLSFEDRVHNPKNNFTSRACTDLAVGFEWDYDFVWSQCDYTLCLALTWEHHAFYNFNQFNFESDSFNNTTEGDFEFGPYANLSVPRKKHGDLFTQGVTLSANLGF